MNVLNTISIVLHKVLIGNFVGVNLVEVFNSWDHFAIEGPTSSLRIVNAFINERRYNGLEGGALIGIYYNCNEIFSDLSVSQLIFLNILLLFYFI